MAEIEKVYAIRENKCLKETMTKEQIEEIASSSNNYSTTETKVGKWIDGKTIYQKTITTVVFNTTQNIVYDINISELNLEDLIDMEAIAITDAKPFAGSKNAKYRVGTTYYYDSNNNYNIYIDCNGKLILDKKGMTKYPIVHITLKYTKTTD